MGLLTHNLHELQQTQFTGGQVQYVQLVSFAIWCKDTSGGQFFDKPMPIQQKYGPKVEQPLPNSTRGLVAVLLSCCIV